MPTDRVGLTLNRQSRNWAGFARWMTYADQDRTADYDGLGEGAAEEIPTAGFNLLSAGVSYRWVAPASEYRIGIKGENLLNEVVRYHTSFVKDAVPGAGRNINLSLAVNF
jgi:iron complex outermembrane receptor protein